jgi:O-methyltransferase
VGVDLAQIRRLINAPEAIRGIEDVRACMARSDCYSLVAAGFFEAVVSLFEDIKKNEVTGDIVVAGVWRGGSSLYLQALNRYFGLGRPLWLSDTFYGFAAADAQHEKDRQAMQWFNRVPGRNQMLRALLLQVVGDRVLRAGSSSLIRRVADYSADRIIGYHFPNAREVEQLFRRAGMWDGNVHILEGPLQVTLPRCPIDAVSLIHLDVDFYEPTRAALDWVYPRLSPGGYVVVDDYSTAFNCKDAVDEFRAANGIEDPLVLMTDTVAFWKISGA